MKNYLSKILALLFCSGVLAVAATPIIDLIDPQSFVRGKGGPELESYQFTVPEAGAATLEIENGAGHARVSSARVWLNGIEVLTPAKFNQQVCHLKVPVTLRAGANLLQVELRSKPGSRLVASLSAPVDAIALLPIAAPLEAEIDSLQCHAVVSALGVPAVGVPVAFSVTEFDGIAPQAAETDDSGVASVTFAPFSGAGLGLVTVQVAGAAPILVDSEAFEVVATNTAPLTLALEQSVPFIALAPGDSSSIKYNLNLAGVAGQTTHVLFSQQVTPVTGLTVANNAPVAGWTLTTDSQWEVTSTLGALTPGLYLVETTATVVETSQTSSAELFVLVDDFGFPGF